MAEPRTLTYPILLIASIRRLEYTLLPLTALRSLEFLLRGSFLLVNRFVHSRYNALSQA